MLHFTVDGAPLHAPHIFFYKSASLNTTGQQTQRLVKTIQDGRGILDHVRVTGQSYRINHALVFALLGHRALTN